MVNVSSVVNVGRNKRIGKEDDGDDDDDSDDDHNDDNGDGMVMMMVSDGNKKLDQDDESQMTFVMLSSTLTSATFSSRVLNHSPLHLTIRTAAQAGKTEVSLGGLDVQDTLTYSRGLTQGQLEGELPNNHNHSLLAALALACTLVCFDPL